MGETTKSYRIKANIGEETFIPVSLEQEYDAFDILSLKIKSEDVYRLHNSNYGVIVGRVLANNGFGIPNAKISVFIESDNLDREELKTIYPFSNTGSKDKNGVRYNLLPDEKVGDCHQIVGTFPNKRYVLDNEDILEIFDKYYKYTTRTNNAGDYMICGVPTGSQTLHMDLDLSDCGILSQRPRDFVYKGYTIEQFENPNMFKGGTSYSTLSQIFSQDQNVYVQPFWGNESLGEKVGITRADIDVAFKFEPTCVFIGSVTSDNSSQGISKKCIPTPNMGNMDELISGEGRIEMIRKTHGGDVEEFQIKGTELINADGVWCYQIPMNLDYMVTDEYGNMVPTDNPERGIPTRARVRFRISMQDMEENVSNFFRPKVLVPHNPQNLDGIDHEDYDYEFGTYTREDSFRDLFWNNVYTVKSYIPRLQKRMVLGWKEDKFTGIKHVQDFGKNSPMPYNNIRIKMPFMFKVMCILIKIFIKTVQLINTAVAAFGTLLINLFGNSINLLPIMAGSSVAAWLIGSLIPVIGNGVALAGLAGVIASVVKWLTGGKTDWNPFEYIYEFAKTLKLVVIEEGLCPDLENWYFAPLYYDKEHKYIKITDEGGKENGSYNILRQTLESINTSDDPQSIDDKNQDPDDEAKCLTTKTDYLISCIEMNLAQEYKVINFDFYNDWINGMIYIPRFMKEVRKKKKFSNGQTIIREKVKGCMDNPKIFSRTRRYTQMCSIGFKKQTDAHDNTLFSKAETNLGNKNQIIKSNGMHKRRGLTQVKIFGKNGGICHEKETMYGQLVYYLKPCEWTTDTTPLARKINLFATDLVLLGSLNDCDMYGVPQAFKHLANTSYTMPTNLALTNLEESAPLFYYGNDETMCSKKNQTTAMSTDAELGKGLQPVTGSPLSSELNFYSGASSNVDVTYDNEPSDTIAVTEAAGIAWNYTGPGQGKIDEKQIYYPGGHFLGISCVNSQTNIKSCINLERICELGASMSQRKEHVREVWNDEFHYAYSVPSGLISGDDIIDDDFRIMFAMMNKNRLIATRMNPNTGYKTYDFVHATPINFSGEFSKYTALNGPYNGKQVEVKDETDLLKRFGIFGGGAKDYDRYEVTYTGVRTDEFPSIDYYAFRLGLGYDDLKGNNMKHNRQFALEKDGKRYLPQYENSFYFYFGTRDGGTALDEFNKQFFSECEKSNLIEKESYSFVDVGGFDLCEGKAPVNIEVNNLNGALYYRIENKETGNIYSTGTWSSVEDIDTIEVPYGEYTLTIRDEEGMELTTDFSVGRGLIMGDYTTFSFNAEVPYNAGKNAYYLERTTNNTNGLWGALYGGYLHGENVHLNVEADDYRLSIKSKRASDIAPTNGLAVVDGAFNYYVSYANEPIEFYLSISKDECKETLIHIATETFPNPGDIKLLIGPVEKTDYRELSPAAYYGMKDEWWKGFDGSETEANWNIRKSLVKESPSSSETFSSYVTTENGDKILFGCPQNTRGIQEELHCSELEVNIPAGYTLDDDMSYYPTSYCSPSYKPYNAIAHNGSTVMCTEGGPLAIVSGNSVVKGIVTGKTEGNKDIFRDGQGYLFKSLTNDDLVPCIYNGDGQITCLFEDGDETRKAEIEEYISGVLFSTITYPVLNKPFSVAASAIVVNTRSLTLSYDGDGNTTGVATTTHKGCKIEGVIENGLTYSGYFGGDTYIPFSEFVGDGMSKFHRGGAKNASVNGNIGDLSVATRYTYFSAWTSGDATNISFSVQEGAPLYKANGHDPKAYKEYEGVQKYRGGEYESYLEYRSVPSMYKFYDDVSFVTSGNSRVLFDFEGETDEDVKYYCVDIDDLTADATTQQIIKEDNSEGTKSSGYVVLWDKDDPLNVIQGNQVLYILGYYRDFTGDKEYLNGKSVVVKVHDSKAIGVGLVAEALYPNDDGIVEMKRETISYIVGFALFAVKDIVDGIKGKFGGNIDFVKNMVISDSGKEKFKWGERLRELTKTTRNPIKKVGEYNIYDSNGTVKYDKVAVVGKKTISYDNGLSKEVVYMVYPTPKYMGKIKANNNQGNGA